MRRLSPSEDREFDFPAHDPAKRAEAIAAMGYRLAAAGPRTRQRLLDRSAIQNAGPDLHTLWLPPGISGEDRNTAWQDEEEAREQDEEPAAPLARLSPEQSRVPVWRAAALLASAVCGFAVVLYGQSLHLDRALHRQAARTAKPIALADADPQAAHPAESQPVAQQTGSARLPLPPTQPDTTQAPREASNAATPDQPAPQATRPAQVAASQPQTAPADSMAPASHEDSHEASPPAIEQSQPAASPQRATPPVADMSARGAAEPPAPSPATATGQPASARLHPPAPVRLAALPRPAPRRALDHATLAWADNPPAPKSLEPKPRTQVRTAPVHHELPRWLTDYHAPPPPRVLVMSPQPHNLDDPTPTQTAAATRPADPPPAPKSEAPPAPRPALIYAEAHVPPPAPRPGYWGYRPYYPSPYYGPYYQPPYGYYGPGYGPPPQ